MRPLGKRIRASPGGGARGTNRETPSPPVGRSRWSVVPVRRRPFGLDQQQVAQLADAVQRLSVSAKEFRTQAQAREFFKDVGDFLSTPARQEARATSAGRDSARAAATASSPRQSSGAVFPQGWWRPPVVGPHD